MWNLKINCLIIIVVVLCLSSRTSYSTEEFQNHQAIYQEHLKPLKLSGSSEVKLNRVKRKGGGRGGGRVSSAGSIGKSSSYHPSSKGNQGSSSSKNRGYSGYKGVCKLSMIMLNVHIM